MNPKNYLLGSAISALFATHASAQVPQLEEVMVTATKRASSVQDVPIAVTALSGESLEKANFSNLRSIVSQVPSVSFANAQGSSSTVSVRIRGVGTTGNNAGFESSVGIFVDGVYQPRPGVALGEMVDVAQVEVLRGPQGTLFGRNTAVGAISVKSNAPIIGETEGFASLTLGDYDLWNLRGAYNLPVSDNLAFRFSGSYRERDGVIETTQKNLDDMHDKDRYLVRAQALWEPTDTVSMRFIADAAGNDESCCVSVGIDPNSDGSFPAGTTLFDKDEFTTDSSPRHDKSDQWGVSTELTWDFDSGTLTWIPSYRESDGKSWGDNDWTSIERFVINKSSPNRAKIESHTEELRFQSTAFDDRLDWLVGAYYSDETIKEISRIHAGPDNPTTQPWAVIPEPPFYGPVGLSGDYWADNHLSQDGETWAIFTHNIFNITNDLSVTLGLRYTDEKKDGGLDYSGGFNPDCETLGPTLIAPGIGCMSIVTPAADSPNYDLFHEEFDDDAWTYTANVNYHLTEDVSTYASVSTGFKSGGINLDVTGSGGTFDSETVTSYELGLKSQWLDGRVTANVAAYYMELDDFQLLSLNSQTVQFSVFNVPDAESKGVELDVYSQLTDNFRLTTAFSWNEAEFPSDCNGSSTNPAVIAQCGNPLPNAPEYVAVVGFSWDIPMGDDLLLNITPNMRWEDETSVNVTDPTIIQDSMTMVDLSLSLTNQANTWLVEVWGKNLLDEAQEYRTYFGLSNTPFEDATAGFISDPVTYGITARYNF